MLHTVNKSPFERNTLEACLKRAVPGTAILLIEDAVYAALAGTGLSDALTSAARRFEVSVPIWPRAACPMRRWWRA
jgi:tRNA 2-thiouridine synthesizing protein B